MTYETFQGLPELVSVYSNSEVIILWVYGTTEPIVRVVNVPHQICIPCTAGVDTVSCVCCPIFRCHLELASATAGLEHDRQQL